jgi:microcystin-dependent protein
MEPYIGEIRMFAGTYAPQGWMTCDGQLMSIAQYSALFAILGTNYGGDGQSTFALPNLASRAPIHSGPNPSQPITRYAVGQAAGQEQVTLSQQQLPSHSHMVNTIGSGGKQWSPAGGFLAGSGFASDGTEVNSYGDTDPDGTLNPKTIAATGGSLPVNVTSPVLAVTFIIAIQGIWPPRP